jgi:hypothetical protein
MLRWYRLRAMGRHRQSMLIRALIPVTQRRRNRRMARNRFQKTPSALTVTQSAQEETRAARFSVTIVSPRYRCSMSSTKPRSTTPLTSGPAELISPYQRCGRPKSHGG